MYDAILLIMVILNLLVLCGIAIMIYAIGDIVYKIKEARKV
jgi:ABC-type Na+ efflux pump permease subunit